jgi:hypothetical protein
MDHGHASARIAVLVSSSLLAGPTAAAADSPSDDQAPSAASPTIDEIDESHEPRDDAAAEDLVDHTDAWGPADPAISPTTPETSPTSPAQVKASAPSEDPDYQSKIKAAEGIAIAGYVFVGLGAASLVLLSGSAWVAAQVAKDRARKDPFFVSEQELYRRAERRTRFARISAIAGGSVLLMGGILIAAGLGSRATLRAGRREVAIAPIIGPTQGLQVQLRF